MSLNDTLNQVVPIIVIVVGVGLFIKVLHEPLGWFWDKIKQGFGWARDRGSSDKEAPSVKTLEWD